MINNISKKENFQINYINSSLSSKVVSNSSYVNEKNIISKTKQKTLTKMVN